MAGVHPLRRWAVFLLRAAALVAGLVAVRSGVELLAASGQALRGLGGGYSFWMSFIDSAGLKPAVSMLAWSLLALGLAKFSLPLAVWLVPPDPALGGGSCARCGHPMVKANKGVCPECGLSGQ